MQNIELIVNNRAGELAWVSEILAKSKVNIVAIATDRHEDGTTTLHLVTDDLARAGNVLRKRKIPFKVHDLLTTTLSDQPGQLAEIAKKIAEAGVNIEFMYLVDKSSGKRTIALVTDDDEKADSIIH